MQDQHGKASLLKPKTWRVCWSDFMEWWGARAYHREHASVCTSRYYCSWPSCIPSLVLGNKSHTSGNETLSGPLLLHWAVPAFYWQPSRFGVLKSCWCSHAFAPYLVPRITGRAWCVVRRSLSPGAWSRTEGHSNTLPRLGRTVISSCYHTNTPSNVCTS